MTESNKKNCTCDKLKVGEAAGTKGKAKFTDPQALKKTVDISECHSRRKDRQN